MQCRPERYESPQSGVTEDEQTRREYSEDCLLSKRIKARDKHIPEKQGLEI